MTDDLDAGPVPTAASRDGALSAGVVAALTTGAVLRVYQYLANRSIFLDEAAIALNLRDRSFAELTQPLNHAQAAPIGYLWLQKVVATTFGSGEYALRAVALAAGLAALPLFVLLARRILPKNLVVPAISWFGVSEFLIFWSSDVKPYALDVLAYLVLTLLALRFLETENRAHGLRLGLAGAFLPYFSHASVIVLAGVGGYLAWRSLRMRAVAGLWPTLFWIGAVPAVLHALTSLDPAQKSYFDAFWAEGFLRLPIQSGAFTRYLERWFAFLYDPGGLPAWLAVYGGASVALAVGLAWIIRHSKATGVLLAPAMATLVASCAHVYPVGARWSFSGRVVLFLIPTAYLVMMSAFAWVRRPRLAMLAASVLAAVAAMQTLATVPISRGDLREVLEYMEAQSRPGDTVYAYYGLRQNMDYYRPNLHGKLIIGSCSQANRQKYLDELQGLRGQARVWVILGVEDAYREHELIETYLRQNAEQLDSTVHRMAEARLYDFSELGNAPVPAELLAPEVGPDEGTNCTGIFAPAPTG